MRAISPERGCCLSAPPTLAAPKRRWSSGSTYDPNVIKRLGAIMVKLDIASARKWYQLAAERGSAAASLELANIIAGALIGAGSGPRWSGGWPQARRSGEFLTFPPLK
jgi:hypothetical protein